MATPIDPTKLVLEEIKKGDKVIIISNMHNLGNRLILGTVEHEPVNWTRISVRYFDQWIGELDKNGCSIGEWVVKQFLLTHLEKPTAKTCWELAVHYKRLALDFSDTFKQISKNQTK